jgi:hypothetical protein
MFRCVFATVLVFYRLRDLKYPKSIDHHKKAYCLDLSCVGNMKLIKLSLFHVNMASCTSAINFTLWKQVEPRILLPSC